MAPPLSRPRSHITDALLAHLTDTIPLTAPDLRDIGALTDADLHLALVSMFGLYRRLSGALVGHLALFEMSSVTPVNFGALARDRVESHFARHILRSWKNGGRSLRPEGSDVLAIWPSRSVLADHRADGVGHTARAAS